MNIIDRRGMLTIFEDGPERKPHELMEALIEAGELPANAVWGHFKAVQNDSGWLYRCSWLAAAR